MAVVWLLHNAHFSHWVLDGVAWLGLLIAVLLLVAGLWRWGCCRFANGGIDPERPIYFLLAMSALPGIFWFVSILCGFVDPASDLWRLWSRLVLLSPYLVMLIVVVIRLLRRHDLVSKRRR